MGASIPLSLCVSLPTFYRRNKHFNVSDKLYTDEDGETTQEDYSIFMRNSHRQIAALLIVNVIGLTINITAAILICKDLQGVSDRLRLLEITFRIIAAVGRLEDAQTICSLLTTAPVSTRHARPNNCSHSFIHPSAGSRDDLWHFLRFRL